MKQPTKKELRKESKAHDKSAKKAFREDHPSIYGRLKMKFGGKYKKN